MTKEMFKGKSILNDNLETWNIHGHKIPVSFAPIEVSTIDAWMPQFWSQVRIYIATGSTEDSLSKIGHNDDLSYDKFLDDAEGDEDENGCNPAQTSTIEDTVLLGLAIKNLLNEVRAMNPKYGRILDLICEDYIKGKILDELVLCKSQGYADIKTAQALARKLYYSE